MPPTPTPPQPAVPARPYPWTQPDGCTCTVNSRDDIVGYTEWLTLDVNPTCPLHKAPDQLPETGDRIRTVHLGPDPAPLPEGLEGTVTDVVTWPTGGPEECHQIQVNWDEDDDGHTRSLNLMCPPDQYEIITDETRS